MKFFVVALALVTICSAVRGKQPFSLDCKDELGLTSEEFMKYRENTENFIDEPKAQNLFKCVFQKFGWIDQNGDFHESAAITVLSAYLTEEQIKQCTATAGDSKSNSFFIKFVACYRAAEDAKASHGL